MQLAKLSKTVLPIYRDLFKSNWPKYMPSYCVLQHFINRFGQHPEWEEKVKFLTLKDTLDGTYALIYGPYICIDSIEAPPYPKLEKLLYNMDLKSDQIFANFRDDFRPLVLDLLRIRKLKKTFDVGSKICFFNVDEDYISGIWKSPPAGHHYASLTIQDLNQVLSTIPNPTPRSIEYLKTVIKYNTTTGLYRSDGLLISWVMEHDTGVQGNVCVVPEFFRMNFARNVLVEHGLKISRKKPYFPIFTDAVHHKLLICLVSLIMNGFIISHQLDLLRNLSRVILLLGIMYK
ncbi:unnamed protein product [Chironomus riparius]|uniref:Uncharacterized protein n=1 Tax=Chironomus riparius TaxID=315576 RepID=A0A9N9S7B2_9DIPT|nr:unnamed protein product [Chironomus riparius]